MTLSFQYYYTKVTLGTNWNHFKILKKRSLQCIWVVIQNIVPYNWKIKELWFENGLFIRAFGFCRCGLSLTISWLVVLPYMFPGYINNVEMNTIRWMNDINDRNDNSRKRTSVCVPESWIWDALPMCHDKMFIAIIKCSQSTYSYICFNVKDTYYHYVQKSYQSSQYKYHLNVL